MKLGFEGKLYFCAAGIGGTPTWTEITKAKNVTLNLSKNEADATTRANGGWKAVKGALKEASIEFDMPWDTTDATLTALQTAYLTNALIGIACMDGGITTAGSQGLWADIDVLEFTRDEPLDDGMGVKVTVKPTISANAPQWKTVAGT